MPDPSPQKNSQADEFLRAFFAKPNGVVPSEDGSAWILMGNSAPPAQAEFLSESIRRVKSREPTLIPWAERESTIWYAIAFQPIQVRILQQWLRAFIGRSFGSFSDIPITLRTTSEAERLLGSLAHSAVFSIKASGAARKPVGDQILRLFRLLSERPGSNLDSWDTASSLLRSFHAAAGTGDLHKAGTILARLKSGAFLDAVNLFFLEIEFFAFSGDWSALASEDRLKNILSLRRPLRIDSLIATAFYHTYLAGKENDPAELRRSFDENIRPLAGSLFSRKLLSDSPEALRVNLLWRLFVTKDEALIRVAAEDLPNEDPTRILAEKHLASLHQSPTATTLPFTMEDARSGIESGDWQRVVEILPHLPASSEALALAIRVAAEIGTASAARFALNQWSRHTPAQQETVLRSRWLSDLWKAVENLCKEQEPNFMPSDPGSWFARIAQSHDWPHAEAAWYRGAGEWDFRTFANSLLQIDSATLVLDSTPQNFRATIRQILPQFLANIPDDLRSSRILKNLYLHAAEFVATTPSLSEEERELLVEASLRALDAGLDDLEYSYLVEECFIEAWKQASSPRAFPWALSLLEIIADRPSQFGTARFTFAQLIFGDAQRYLSRLAHSQILLLRDLLRVSGMEELANCLPTAPASREVIEEAKRLSENTIRRLGIYTLMEPAAKRARMIIQSAHPNLQVIINADHVATPALRSMARDCDALLIVTSCAKHAATGCIEQNKRGQPLLYVSGKGSSSILSGWETLLEGLTS